MTGSRHYHVFRTALAQLRPPVAFAVLPPYLTTGRILECLALGVLLYIKVLPSLIGMLFFLAAFLLMYRVRITALLIGLFWTLFWPLFILVAVFYPLFSRVENKSVVMYVAAVMCCAYLAIALFRTRVLPHIDMGAGQEQKKKITVKRFGNVLEFPSEHISAPDKKDSGSDGQWLH